MKVSARIKNEKFTDHPPPPNASRNRKGKQGAMLMTRSLLLLVVF